MMSYYEDRSPDYLNKEKFAVKIIRCMDNEYQNVALKEYKLI